MTIPVAVTGGHSVVSRPGRETMLYINMWIIIAVILGVLLRVVAHFMPGDTTPPSSDMKLNDVRSKATMDRL